MEERRADCILHQELVKQIGNDVADMKKLLRGNGVLGVAEMARRAFETCMDCKKTKNGWLDWAFRVFIGVLISFIAVRLGLK